MPEKWETIEATDVFEASPYVTVRKEKLITGGGKVIDDFYQVLLRRFAICVPVTSAGEIVTIWQYKHGPRRESLTFPAGFVEDGEDPADCCRRELLEETGYAADRLVPLGEFVDNGNQRGCVGHYFAALDCQKAGRARQRRYRADGDPAPGHRQRRNLDRGRRRGDHP